MTSIPCYDSAAVAAAATAVIVGFDEMFVCLYAGMQPRTSFLLSIILYHRALAQTHIFAHEHSYFPGHARIG